MFKEVFRMNFPEDLKYVKSHEWVKTLEDGTVLVGVSDYAQDALGDLVFVKRHSGRDQRGTVRRPGIHQRGAL